MKKGPATREERLAAALRENLKRRKVRARALAQAEPGKPQDKSTEGPPSRHQDATKRV
jgi:hypothetical protein